MKTTQDAGRTAIRTPDVAARELARELSRTFGDACLVYVLTADGRFLAPLAAEHRDPLSRALLREIIAAPVEAGQGLSRGVLATGAPVRVAGRDRIQAQTRADMQGYVRTMAVGAACVVPVLLDGAVAGTVGVMRDGEQAAPFSARDAQDIAERVAAVAPVLAEARTRARDPLAHPLLEDGHEFRHGFDTALIGMAFLTPDGRFARVNRALAEMLGRDEHDLVDVSALDVTHPEHRADVERCMREAAAGAWRTHTIDTRVRRPAGDALWVQVSSRLVVDAEDTPRFFFCQYVDVTERKRAELLLAESQRAGRVGSFEWIPALKVTRWSEEMYRIHGVDRETFGASLEEYLALVHPEDRATVEPSLLEALRLRDGRVHVRYRVCRPDGTVVAVESRGMVESGPDGRVARLVGTCVEVAPRDGGAGTLRDQLTGLPGRSLFVDRVRATGGGRRAVDRWTAVVVSDLDGFARVNLHRGPAAGDAVLAEAARRLRDALRSDDIAARLSGDRMAAYCIGIESEDTLAALARRVQAALEAPYLVDGGEVELTASLGLAAARPGAAADETLLHAAESALRRAKGQGGACIEFLDEHMQAHVRERARLQEELRLALRTGMLEVHYQPLVRLPDRAIVGAEALLRWRDPRFAHVGAGELIAAAESGGLIGELGGWVLETACRAASAWAVPIELSVNLSPRQLRDAGLARSVAGALESCGLDPRRLRLEVTESAAVEDPDRACAVLAALRDEGVRVSLDDFGTGYSSLRHLHRLPVTELKIDRSFVADEHGTPLLTSIVRMGIALDLQVTAEGVETEDQFATVTELGCTRAQGFLFARAVSGDELEALLAAGRL